jgi:hypothetical protein
MADTARMLSPTSLAAFSSAPVLAGSGAVRSVQRARAVAPQPTQPAAPMASASPRASEGDTTSNRILPRGSLLDLSV